ncbi:MAG TPA: response regulator [Vicinamibacterales bacterium]|nr:response regulator [Vicinamibacterales bacterium]
MPRALIVEDDWREAQQFTRRLESNGIRVLGVAATGADGLRFCEELRPDLVLLDIDLDGPVSGLDLIVPIRALAPTAFVLVATDPSDARVARLADLEAASLVIRPVQDAELRTALGVALRDRAGRSMAIADSEEAFAQVFDIAPDAMLVVQQDGQISRVNAAFERQFGYSAAAIKGEPVEVLLPRAARKTHAQNRSWFTRHPQVRRMGERQPLVACRADGSEFPVDISLAPFGTGPGARVLAIVRDASERRQLADAQRERQALEEQLARVLRLETVGRLAGGVAHDFNNLLMVIGGYVDALLEGRANAARQQEMLEGIRSTTNRATELTSQLLAFGRRQVLQPQAVDIADCIGSVRGLMSRAIGEAIEIRTTIAAGVAPVRVDASQFEQVLLNLALNARDAMPKGGTLTFAANNLTIRQDTLLPGATLSGLRPGEYVQLTVRDNGCGMPAEAVARAFEPFFTTKEPGKGIGMGLASAYGIVRQSGGCIWIESEAGTGTSVMMLLPVATSAPRPDAAAQRPGVPPPAARVLLVEDEPHVRAMLSDSLQAAGYAVIEAADGLAALHQFHAESPKPDLVVTDVIMPRCGGPELVSTMRRLQPDLLAIFISGYASDPESPALQDDSRTAFLHKPFAVDRLRQRVAEMLSTRSVAADLPPADR